MKHKRLYHIIVHDNPFTAQSGGQNNLATYTLYVEPKGPPQHSRWLYCLLN